MANLASLIAAEYAFADLAARLGTHDAFLTHLAEDSILFRPKPVPGKTWIASQSAREGLLTWYPSFATLAQAGDLGCTTGPWTFRPGGPAEDPIVHGYFASLWRVQPDGQWKVGLDCGIACPLPPTPPKPLRFENLDEPDRTDVASLDLDQICRSLLAVERTFADGMLHDKVAALYERYGADETHIYRTGVLPYHGCATIRDDFAVRPGAYFWQPLEVRASLSGDLGYVYGLAQFIPAGHSDAIESCYLRVWKQLAGGWRILVDVDCPISDS